MPWFPTALLPSTYPHWEAIDSNSAKVIVKYGGIKSIVTFYFNEKGPIVKLNADRYRAVNNSYLKGKWVGYYREYIKVNNMMMSKEIEDAWNLSSGEFSYVKFEITYIEYNNPRYER